MPPPRPDRGTAARRFRTRTLMIAAALVALAMGGWMGIVRAWDRAGKASYCRGWAVQHAAEAKQFWKEAASPGLSAGEARSYRMAARNRAIMVRKYQAVADDPSLPYPGTPYPKNPIWTPEEVANEPDQPVDP